MATTEPILKPDFSVEVPQSEATESTKKGSQQPGDAKASTSTSASSEAANETAQAVSKPALNSSWSNPDSGKPEGATRLQRTVKILLTKGKKGYSREMFLEHLRETVGVERLEACGPTAAPHIWQLTFDSEEAKKEFEDAGDFPVKGETARILKHGKPGTSKVYIRVHWVPYHIHMSSALKGLENIEGLKILYANYDKCRTPGMEHVRTTVRSVCVLVDDVSLIPYYMGWSTKSEHGRAMITVKDRAPKCLRCDSHGHVRKDCPAVKCNNCGLFGHLTQDCIKPRAWSQVVGPLVEEDPFEGALLQEDDDTIAPSTSNLGASSSTPKGEAIEPSICNSDGENATRSALSKTITLAAHTAAVVATEPAVIAAAAHAAAMVAAEPAVITAETTAVTANEPINNYTVVTNVTTFSPNEDDTSTPHKGQDTLLTTESIADDRDHDLNSSIHSVPSSTWSGTEDAMDEDSASTISSAASQLKSGHKRVICDSPETSSPVSARRHNSGAVKAAAKRLKKSAKKKLALKRN
jgi:hypothetical protein